MVSTDASADRLPFRTSPLERFGERRRDTAFLEAARVDPAARLLVVGADGLVPLDADGGLRWRTLAEAPVGATLVFLGVDAAGRPLFSAEGDDDGQVSFREVGAALEDLEAAAALEAIALAAWHARGKRCVACGEATEVQDGGHLRRCVACGTGHFPRTDPAVIMLVSDGERCVLGRRPNAPAGRWSTLAGFVEAGESLEAAVAREVFEESGLVVRGVRYRGSQPWPFPASLMVAFEADAEYGPLTLSEEHAELRWFGRDELADAIARNEVLVPGSVSAGSYLIRSWLAGAPRS